MPQHAKLRKKNVGNATYWYTEAGGPTYFGNIEDIPYRQAKKLFADHTQSLLDEKKEAKLLLFRLPKSVAAGFSLRSGRRLKPAATDINIRKSNKRLYGWRPSRRVP